MDFDSDLVAFDEFQNSGTDQEYLDGQNGQAFYQAPDQIGK